MNIEIDLDQILALITGAIGVIDDNHFSRRAQFHKLRRDHTQIAFIQTMAHGALPNAEQELTLARIEIDDQMAEMLEHLQAAAVAQRRVLANQQLIAAAQQPPTATVPQEEVAATEAAPEELIPDEEILAEGGGPVNEPE